MTLLCIKAPTECTYANDKSKAPSSGKDPIVGEYYNSVNDILLDDGLYYFLEGFRTDECFHNSLFALPSDLDETTLVNEEFEEKYCLPVNK